MPASPLLPTLIAAALPSGCSGAEALAPALFVAPDRPLEEALTPAGGAD